MDSFEFSEFEIKTDYLIPTNQDRSPHNKRIKGKFLKGPIPWKWLSTAANVSKRGLHIAICLFFIAGMTNKNTVKMQGKILRDLGVCRQTFYKTLDKMKDAGLVSVERRPGQTYLITLLDCSEG